MADTEESQIRETERAGQAETARYFRWALPLAAGIALSVGAVWWTITLRHESAPLIRLRDGGRELVVGLDGQPGGLTALPETLREALAQTLRTAKLQIAPEVEVLGRAPGATIPAAETAPSLRVLAPRTTAVPDGTPLLQWTGVPEATGYKIDIVEQTSGALVLSQEVAADAQEWRPIEPLPAGETFAWKVQALRDGAVIAQSAAAARFEVLGAGRLAEWEEWKRLADGSHLLLGVASARAGLLDEAAREFRLLVEENPDSRLAKKLLEQAQSR